MPVPDFQSMMLPFLKFASDGEEHTLSNVTEFVAQQFNLTKADREERLPSGNQTRLDNRVGWCRTHLKNAKLIEYVKLGVFRITERGKQVLSQNPQALNLKFLDQFPEHFAWFHQEKEDAPEKSGTPNSGTANSPEAFQKATPEEQFQALATGLKQKLASEILDRVKTMNPYRFERLVLDLLIAMGYGGSREEAAELTQKSNDEGIDGLINEDRLGLERIYVQAKRWQGSVGRPDIQGFVGALAGKHAQKGIFITTSDFSANALEYAKHLPQRVILIDGKRLAILMVEHNIAVSTGYTYEVKRIDSDYFEDV